MTPTLATLTRPEVGRTRADVRITPPALRLLERLQAEAGDVALIVAPRLSGEVLCVGRRDVTLGPNDLLIATVRGCPIYIDRREPSPIDLVAMVLDVDRDVAGLKFVFRQPADGTP